MRSLFGWRRRRPGRTILAFEVLEDRCQPTTTVAPDLLTQWDTGISSHDNVTRERQPAFAGTTTSPIGTAISLFVDGLSVASTTVTHAGGGPFSLTPSLALGDGAHTAQFYDSKFNALSSALSFTIDSTPPGPPATPVLLSADDLSNVSIQIQGDVGDLLHVAVNGHDAAAVAASGDLQTVAVDLAALGVDGSLPYTIVVTAEDAAGNVGPPSDSVTHVPPASNPAPLVSNASVSPGTLSPNGDGVQDQADVAFDLGAAATVVVDFYDNADKLLGSIPVGQLEAGHQEFKLDVPQFTEGTYTLSVAATDLQGVAAAPATTTFVIDLTPPVEPTIAFAAGQDTGASADDGITAIASPTFSGTAEPGTVVDIAEGDVRLGDTVAGSDGSWSVTVSLSEGHHTLAAYSTDNGGNSSVSQALNVVVDTQSPIVDVGPDLTGSQGVPVTLTANVTEDNLVSQSWELLSTDSGASIPPADGATITVTPSQPGTYVFVHRAVDAAGNVGQAQLTLVVSANLAPTISVPATRTAYHKSSVAVGPALAVSDPDSSSLTVRLTIDRGGMTFQTLSASSLAANLGQTSVTIVGSPETINSVLSQLRCNFGAGDIGTATVRVDANDSSDPAAAATWRSSASFQFNIVNRAPTASASLNLTMVGNTTLTVAAPGLSALFSDLDGDPLTYKIASPPTTGVLIINADGSYRYTPPTGFVGTVTFAVRAYDGLDYSSPLTVTIHVSQAYVVRRSR